MNAEEIADKLRNAEELPEIAQQLISAFREDRTAEFEQYFEIVEDRIIYGDDDVRGRMILQFLENLKNFSALQDLDCAVFEPWLGAESHVAWRWLEKRWQGKSLEQATRKK